MTRRVLSDEFDAHRIQCLNEFHQRIHITADDAFARFHALDGGQREAGKFGEFLLREPGQSPGGTQLGGGYHV